MFQGLLLLATIVLSSSAFGQTVPAEVNIESIETRGPACPAGSTAVNISEDRKAMTILFDSYSLSLDAGSRFSSWSYTRCDLSIKVKATPGWAWSAYTFDYRGFSNLAPRTAAVFRTYYYFGGLYRHFDQLYQRGPMAQDFSHRVNVKAPLWSNCDGRPREIKVKSQLWLVGKEAAWNLDSIDGEVTQTVGLRWRRCN